MQKEPEYYGKARQVNEGPVDFRHLDNLDYKSLESIAYEAAQREDNFLKRAALTRMDKKYLDSVISWVKSANERKLDDLEYLEQCNELLRYGLNNRHEDILIKIWPLIKEKSEKLAVNSRLSGNSSIRKTYHYYSNAVEVAAGLRERVDII